jgi:hypothetical protein
LLLLAAVIAAFVAAQPSPTHAQQVLPNPGFEGSLAGWTTSGILGEPAHSGDTALVLEILDDVITVRSSNWFDAQSATVAAEIYARASATVQVTLAIEFVDEGFQTLFPLAAQQPVAGAYERIAVAGPAPIGASLARFVVTVEPGAGTTVWLDSALLDIAGEPPTATPTATATETPTAEPTAASTATNTPKATSTPQPGGTAAGPTATRTPTPTRTAVPGATATRTPPPGATATPSLPTGGSAPGPVVVVPGGAGGLLANAGFEQLANDVPAGWSKVGGDLYASPNARSGMYAGMLLSLTNSTKWLYQAAPVEGGRWYAFDAWGRRESGDGEFFLRLSWYASSDGSGTTLSQVDSLNTSTATTWTHLETGPVQAPPAARSVRARLMVRPAAPVSISFDDARLLEVPAPTPTPQPTATATSTAKPTPQAGNRPPPTVRSGGSAGSGDSPAPRFAGTFTGALTLRINEVMPNPAEEPDNRHEWVELYNFGDEPVDFSGWWIEDAQNGDPLASVAIPPGGYVLVAGGDYVAPEGVPVVRVADGRIGLGLNNGGDVLRLLDPSGTVVDSISYGDNTTAFVLPPPAPGSGETIGLGPDGWGLTLRPTPGRSNEFAVAENPTAEASPSPTRAAVLSTDDEAAPRAEGAAPLMHAGDPGGSSPWPWLLLGGAAGAGLLATGSRLLRWAPRLLRHAR